MARNAAIRFEIESALPAAEIISIFKKTLTKSRGLQSIVTNPSKWELARPPADASTAAVWVRNARDERIHATKPGGFQDAATEMNVGSVIALAHSQGENGRTRVEMWSAVLKSAANGKTSPVARQTIRHQMKRVGDAVRKKDPSATLRPFEEN